MACTPTTALLKILQYVSSNIVSSGYNDSCIPRQAWHPKMKPGTTMMFNDYQSPSFPGVAKAVDEFAQRIGRTVECCAGPGNAYVVLPP